MAKRLIMSRKTLLHEISVFNRMSLTDKLNKSYSELILVLSLIRMWWSAMFYSSRIKIAVAL
jgi:hypothetical protein